LSQTERKISQGMKTGLVLEGGALRGLFSAGVTDVMMEEGIHFDGIVGVSAGACFGANIKSGQNGRSMRYNVVFAHDWRYCSLRSLITTGDLYGAQFAYHDVPNRLDPFDDEAFAQSDTAFHLVCTDCRTGQPYYHECHERGDELYEWMRASASMPLAARPVHIGDRVLLDGGITDSIPLRYFQRQGYHRNVVILTQPLGYKKKPMRMMPVFRWALRRYPKVVEALANRYKMYNAELDYVAKQQRQGSILLIAPSETLPIARVSHDQKKMKQTYELGRETARRLLPSIREFMENRVEEVQEPLAASANGQ
jgi:predicted patatin/cPLA2 family phospholipase